MRYTIAKSLAVFGGIMIFALLFIPIAYLGWKTQVIDPIRQGYLPLHSMAVKFGVSDVQNLIAFGVALLPFVLIFSAFFIAGEKD